MELRRYLWVIRRRAPIIVLAVLMALGVAYATRPRGITYSASAMIYVGNRLFSDSTELSQDRAGGLQRVAATFAVLIATEPVAQEAIESSGVSRSPTGVAGSTIAAVVPGTSLIKVVYTDPDPLAAQQIANALSDALVARAATYEPSPSGEGDVPILPAYVVTRSKLPVVPDSTGAGGRLALAAAFGLTLSLAIVFLVEYLDLTVKTPEDLEDRLSVPVLGVLPRFREEAWQAPASSGRFSRRDRVAEPAGG
jgi:capsular polysaccharide biosynthesis protein